MNQATATLISTGEVVQFLGFTTVGGQLHMRVLRNGTETAVLASDLNLPKL